jgi:transposase InsO family protein
MHSLAKTTPYQRLQITIRVIDLRHSVASVACSLAISVRTVYKWLKRFREEGLAGLHDRSSRPQRSPARLPEQVLAELRQLRLELRLNATRIARCLGVARSTVSAWLQRLGLRRLPALAREPVQRYEHPRPGDLLHLDCKQLGRIAAAGHAVTGDRSQRSRGVGWERMHVCVDDHSRLAVCEILPDELGPTAAGFLRRTVAQYARQGVKVRALLTDNGPCYRSRVFRQACTELGLQHRFTRPYRPQTNGKAERFIRTAMEECLYACSFNHSSERSSALATWLHCYNHSRPHSAIGNRPPASRLPACE